MADDWREPIVSIVSIVSRPGGDGLGRGALMPTQAESLELLGIDAKAFAKAKAAAKAAKRAARKAKATQLAKAAKPVADEPLQLPRSFHDPLSRAQTEQWQQLMYALACALTGTWDGPRELIDRPRRGWESLESVLRTVDETGRTYDPTSSAMGHHLEVLSHGLVGTGGSGGRNGVESAVIGELSMSALGEALHEAYRPRSASYAHRHGLSYDTCVRILVERVCGIERWSEKQKFWAWRRTGCTSSQIAKRYGTTENVAHAVAAHGRRVVRIELCARELLPLPHPNDPIFAEVRRRLLELRAHGR